MQLSWRGMLAASLLALAAGSVYYARWQEQDRLPPGWQWRARFIGGATTPDLRTGQFPANDTSSFYERQMAVVADIADGVVLEDHYSTVDTNTRKITWDYAWRAPLRRHDASHLAPAHAGSHAVFPRNVQRATYVLRYSYVKGVPLAFEGEDLVEGLPTYRFGYRGRGEYTESYAGTAQYPGEQLEPGQEIRCADDQFQLRFWVEPQTGETVKVEEGCRSGDYVYAAGDPRPLRPVMRWYGTTASDDVLDLVLAVEKRLYRWRFWHGYLPVLAVVLAGLLLLDGLLRRRRRP